MEALETAAGFGKHFVWKEREGTPTQFYNDYIIFAYTVLLGIYSMGREDFLNGQDCIYK